MYCLFEVAVDLDRKSGVVEVIELVSEGGVNLWRQADAARYLGVARQRVRVLIARGDLATVSLRSVRYVEHNSLMAYARVARKRASHAELLGSSGTLRS